MSEYILNMKNISKDFSGVKALADVTFSVRKGEIHALCGENGAGKSTLMKILSGVWAFGTYEGEIDIDGQVQQFHNVRDSERAGISIIYQELALISEMDVGENVYLNEWFTKNGLIDFPRIYHQTKEACQELRMRINPTTKVRELGVGIQQLIEIAKTITKKSDILILDEPTASLTETEVELLMGFLDDLRKNGVTCIYISHKLDEILRISDHVTVLRDGKMVGTYVTSEINEGFLIKQMVGRELTDRFPYEPRATGDVVFEVRNYTVFKDNDQQRKLLDGISFKVNKGEIVGIAGLMGAGRTELALSLFGYLEGKKQGEVYLNGKKADIRTPSDAIKLGMAMVSEDRKGLGLFSGQSVLQNIVAASLDKITKHGVINEEKQLYWAKQYQQILKIKTSSLSTMVQNLSGGNQQKVVLAKWLMTNPVILFLDEPTRGIDVGAKYEIYNTMLQLASQGVSIVLISSELPEILGMSDRVLVMHQGRMWESDLTREQASQERIMYLATGGKTPHEIQKDSVREH